MAGGVPSKFGKPAVTEKKKRKRPSKKVPTTVLESSSTNFMDLVQKLTGSAAELQDGERRAKAPAVHAPAVAASSSYYFQGYLNNSNTIATSHNNDNDSTSSSSHSGAHAPAYHGSFVAAMDPTSSGWNSPFNEDDELYSSGYDPAGDGSNSSAASWRDPAGHAEVWYHHQMDAMRA